MNNEYKPFSAYTESLRITKLIFNEVYAKEFSDRKEFDTCVIDLLKKNKLNGAEYTYYSLYFLNNFTVHVNVVIDNCFSPTTFTFCMIWNADGDGRKLNRFNDKYSMDNISTYIGAPAYWFGRNGNTSGIIDEIKLVI